METSIMSGIIYSAIVSSLWEVSSLMRVLFWRFYDRVILVEKEKGEDEEKEKEKEGRKTEEST